MQAVPAGQRAPLAPANRQLPPQPVGKAGPGPLDFTQYHTGWIDKQEAAFKAWLNAVLMAAPVDSEAGEGGGAATPAPRGLASRRLVARLRGLLWQLYSQDQELIAVMLKVEQRIDGGQLKLRDEVWCGTRGKWPGWPGLAAANQCRPMRAHSCCTPPACPPSA